jgi:5-methyltetrahydrofolate--homocysteine methyltransferase
MIDNFEQDHDDYSIIMVKALADRLAEAMAEKMHEDVRKLYWAYSPDENLSKKDLLYVKYPGIRPAPGYPTQPDHTEKNLMWKLMNVHEEIGIELTENLAMDPASSVSGLYFANPNCEYFGVGSINEDQIIDYSNRKEMSKEEVEQWLSSNLAYK